MSTIYTLKLTEDEKARVEALLSKYVEGCRNYSLMDADLLTRLRATVPDQFNLAP